MRRERNPFSRDPRQEAPRPSSKCRKLAPLAALGLFLTTQVQSQPADLEKWLRVETPHFTMLTDAEARRGIEIIARLEQFRATFARLGPSLELRSPAPTTLYAFRDAESYAPYKTRQDSGSTRILGQFTKTQDGNYLSLDAGSSLTGSFAVIYHEYVHFLVLNNFPRVPLWFNEGLAEYYSTFSVEDDKAVLGEPVERHVRWLRRDGDFSLDDLLRADTGSETYHDPSEVGRFYALSWALVHYLLSGGQEEIDRAVDYFVLLVEGEEPDRAFERAFGRGLGAMEDELRAYLETGNFATTLVRLPRIDSSRIRVRRSAPADTLYHLGDLAAHLGKSGLAESHFHAALDHGPRHAEAHAGLALVRNQQQRWQEAEVLYQDAMKFGAKSPLSYLLYGRHALVGTRQAEGEQAEKRAKTARQSLGRAIELFPDFGEAHALLASAHLLPGGDHEQALSAIRQARELLPSRLDLVELQIKVHLQRHEIQAAERLVLRELEPRTGDLDRVNQAWEDIERTGLLIDSQKAFEAGELERGLELLDEAVHITTDPGLRERLEGELVRLQNLDR